MVISVGADGHMFIQVLDVHGGLSNVDRTDTLATKTGLEQEQERSKQLSYHAQREQRLQDLAAAREAAALGDVGPLERYERQHEGHAAALSYFASERKGRAYPPLPPFSPPPPQVLQEDGDSAAPGLECG